MAARSPPIDIVMSSSTRPGSSSPGNKTSNLTSALQASSGAAPGSHNPSRPISSEARAPPVRQDSLGFGLGTPQGASRPISVGGMNRRESAQGGSYMNGGMSWGGVSVGSFLQDDIMMGGMSPALNSPSFHSSSYLPKMEANFWRNLKCCETNFEDLHELVAHFEEVHKQAPANFPHNKMSIPGGNYLSRRKSGNSNTSNTSDPMRPIIQNRGLGSMSDNKANGMASSKLQQQFQQDARKSSMSAMQDMETIGEMEMDDDNGGSTDQSFPQFSQQMNQYPTNSTTNMQNINPTFQNMVNGQHGYHTSNGQSTNGIHRANPMMSSVNTPNFGVQQGQNMQQTVNPQAMPDQNIMPQFNSNAVPFNAQMLQKINNDFSGMDFGNNNEMLDLCINEPAKNLYSADGGINSQQFPHFNFTNGTSTTTDNSDENAKKLQAQRLASGAGKTQTEEERPFKCPVIGCEKAYKNANGLRYHEKHGHATQKLKANGDGTFSIVDPVTEMPYPGTVGMEKEKPYRCEVCGKRYKNLNGLKYHRNHSPPCNPEFNNGSGEGTGDVEVDGEPDDVEGDEETIY